MSPRRAGLVALLILVVGAAAFSAWRVIRGPRSSADFPDGILMLCTDPSCGRAFTTTLTEIARVRAADEDAPIPCPACGKPAVRGRECPHCHGVFAAEKPERERGGAPACPLCHEALPHLAG